EDGSDPQALLRDVVGRVSVTSFDTSEPSLYDIFLELAGAGREQKIATDGSLVSEEIES
ncbi:MAG: DUF4162 domain-containing protein, partial [Candidatus Eisenbacteria sp.]|nr:DUF4162 domain-containing protein [Candidatus Eisenbacteria bacterium]